MSAQKGAKSAPMTKEEVMQLVELVQVHPILFNKATNATNNQLKDETWKKITNLFNAAIASCPRKPEQLRLKWENLKKLARKRNTRIRMNNLKTGGGKPENIPPDDALDKVADILGPTCDGYNVNFGGDAEESGEGKVEKTEPDIEEVDVPFNLDSTSNNEPAVPKAAKPKKFFFSSAKSTGKAKVLNDDLKASVIRRNNAIAEYYESKKMKDQVGADLRNKKIELEILTLQKKLENNDEKND